MKFDGPDFSGMLYLAMKIDNALIELIRISQITGSDLDLVQGGGGNNSAKTADGKYMYIKASGTSLKNMSEQKGWRRLVIDKVLEVVKDVSLETLDVADREGQVVKRLLEACDDDRPDGIRPSIEAHLHALLGQTYVVHLHPRVISAYVNARDGRAVLEKLFADEQYPILWVDYKDPGFLCGRQMAQVVDDYLSNHDRYPSIIFLEKHGLFTASNDGDDIIQLVRHVVNRCESNLPKFAPARKISPSPKQITKSSWSRVSAFIPPNSAAHMRTKMDISAVACAVATVRSLPAVNSPTPFTTNARACLYPFSIRVRIIFSMAIAVGSSIHKAGPLA